MPGTETHVASLLLARLVDWCSVGQCWRSSNDSESYDVRLLGEFDKLPDELTPEIREEPEREVAVTLPIKYWLSNLAAISHSCNDATEEIEALRRASTTDEDLNELKGSTLIAPIYVRAASSWRCWPIRVS